MRAVFHHSCGPWLRYHLDALKHSSLKVDIITEASGLSLDRALAHADVLLHVLHPVTAAMMDAAPRLRLIQKIGVGLDMIDLAAARERDIAVCNMLGTNTQAVAEATLGLMLAVLRQIPALDARLRNTGVWNLPPEAQGTFGEIGGKTVGLVGFGAVARRLAGILSATGATVIATSRHPFEDEAVRRVDKVELLERSDIVSLHVPAMPETRNWLDSDAITRMKRGAVLINTARGSLVDEAALVDALQNGHLSGAGLDVFSVEPLPRDAPILSMPNVVVQPHLAWLTRETFMRSLDAIQRNVDALRKGQPLENRYVG